MSARTVSPPPSWKFAMEVLIAVLEDGTDEGKRLAKEELRDLAKRLDAMNKEPS